MKSQEKKQSDQPEILLSNGEIVSEKPRFQTRDRYMRPVWKSDGNDPIHTQQSFKAECDINTIVNRAREKGIMPTNIRQPFYGDFSDVPTFENALKTVMEAEDRFMSLPAKVRAQFDNDPRQFLAFADNPENAAELVKLGFATERVPTPEDPVLSELKTLNANLSGGSSDPTPPKSKTKPKAE